MYFREKRTASPEVPVILQTVSIFATHTEFWQHLCRCQSIIPCSVAHRNFRQKIILDSNFQSKDFTFSFSHKMLSGKKLGGPKWSKANYNGLKINAIYSQKSLITYFQEIKMFVYLAIDFNMHQWGGKLRICVRVCVSPDMS